MFEVVIRNHSPTKWEWQLHDNDGKVLLHGSEKTRPAARYQGDRALFQLLLIRPTSDQARRPG